MYRGRRLIGGAVAFGVLLAVSSCGLDQAGAPPADRAAHGGHGSQPPGPAAPLRGGERFVTLTMPQPYAPAAPNGGTDEYRCFLVDPGLTTEAFLTGSQFLPQNADIVHHAIFFRIDSAQRRAGAGGRSAEPGRGLDVLRRRRHPGRLGVGRALGAGHR